ncbi:MAG: DUF2344 domain-containing protein [Firmicutes bacterium]|jgi:radical SAM-linked protein|nr:DUF2344 domain-containing protein [Bacillota bacterium]
MSQYAIKFSKEGYICYTSHLDLLRLFKRAFKKAGIRLSYSQGFNPHPKMGFAQPLSLGYVSVGEYLEFETDKAYDPGELKDLISAQMPEGIRIFSCESMGGQKRSLASRNHAAEYIIGMPMGRELGREEVETLCCDFLAQESILVLKKQKKSGKTKEVDIRGKIQSLNFLAAGENLLITGLLDSGSQSNLSPELLIAAIATFLGVSLDRSEVGVMRTKLFFE